MNVLDEPLLEDAPDSQPASEGSVEVPAAHTGSKENKVLEGRLQHMMTLIGSYMMANMLMKASALKDLSYSHFAALMLIDRWEVSTIKEIAGLLHMELPTASRVIDKLVDLGYVERTEGTVDRRYKEVRVTDEGGKLILSVGETRRKAISRMVTHLSEQDIATYIRLLEALVQEISAQDLLPGLLQMKRCGLGLQTPVLCEDRAPESE